MLVILEYIIVFILLYFINALLVTNKKTKSGKQNISIEVLYMKKVYNIKLKKEEQKNFYKIINIINAFIMTTIYIILVYLVKGWILKIIFGLVLIVLMTIICYGLLGRYYLWKEGNK